MDPEEQRLVTNGPIKIHACVNRLALDAALHVRTTLFPQ